MNSSHKNVKDFVFLCPVVVAEGLMYLSVTAFPRVQFVSAAESTTCIHVEGSHHRVRRKFVYDGYEDIFQVNPLMHLSSPTLSNECKSILVSSAVSTARIGVVAYQFLLE